jgi:hypothetical protein
MELVMAGVVVSLLVLCWVSMPCWRTHDVAATDLRADATRAPLPFRGREDAAPVRPLRGRNTGVGDAAAFGATRRPKDPVVMVDQIPASSRMKGK